MEIKSNRTKREQRKFIAIELSVLTREKRERKIQHRRERERELKNIESDDGINVPIGIVNTSTKSTSRFFLLFFALSSFHFTVKF